MHKHHHAMSAGQAFTKFGVITHHGTGLLAFWAIAAVLVLFAIAMARGNRRARSY